MVLPALIGEGKPAILKPIVASRLYSNILAGELLHTNTAVLFI